jgi:hypothetical protein
MSAEGMQPTVNGIVARAGIRRKKAVESQEKLANLSGRCPKFKLYWPILQATLFR